MKNLRIQLTAPGGEWWPSIAALFPAAVAWMNDPQDSADYRLFAAVRKPNEFLGGAVIEIGTLYFGPLADVPAGFLENIEVLAPHRRKGVGTALLRAALACAWQAGCESVRGHVDYKATAAISLYRREGFGFVPQEDPDDGPEAEQTYSIVAIHPARRHADDRGAGSNPL